MKAGAFIEDNEGHRLDVNTDYLFDPKMSTYVLVPSSTKLKVISPKAIKSVYVVADNRVMVTYNGWEYGAKLVSGAASDLKSYQIGLDGSSNIIEIYSFDKTQDVKIYYLAFQEVSITMDVTAHITGATRGIVTAPIHSVTRKINDLNKAFYRLTPVVETWLNQMTGSGYQYMPISVLRFQGLNTVIFAGHGINILQKSGNIVNYNNFSSYAITDLDEDGYKEIYTTELIGGEIKNTIFYVIYEKNPNITTVEISVAGAPISGIVLLGAGDIDSDGHNELIVYYGDYPNQSVGYIKLNKNRYEFHELYTNLELASDGRMVDFVIVDYDGDGTNELYIVGVGQVYKIWNDRGIWKGEQIVLGFGDYNDAGVGYYNILYFNNKIYVKSAYHLYSISPDFIVDSTSVMPGVGLREISFMGKKYLVTGGITPSGGSSS